MLVSRDEQSCLVVTYREIKNCVDAAFGYVGALVAVYLPCSFSGLFGTDSDSPPFYSFHSSELSRNR